MEEELEKLVGLHIGQIVKLQNSIFIAVPKNTK